MSTERTTADEPGMGAGVPDAASDDTTQYGYLGFTLREVLIVGAWLIAFVISFFPLVAGQPSLWGHGLHWILPIGVPTVAVFLIVLRRFSPQGIRRVGSLGIDQFASVAFSAAVAFWLPMIGDAIVQAIRNGVSSGWVMWVEFVLMLALVVFTVFAPLIPGLRVDFRGRPRQPSHPAASPIRPVAARPRIESEGPAHTVYSEPDPVPEVQEPFWALAPTERDVVDEAGVPVFRIGPSAWALVIEEREDSFLVRHEDGRTGRLYEISDVTRG